MTEFTDILEMLTPEVHQNLKRAVEIGKWADGTPLSREQRELCMQAVIAYEARHCSAEERTGYIDRGHKAGDNCDSAAADEPAVIRIVRSQSGLQ
jgi:uncharacterized protein